MGANRISATVFPCDSVYHNHLLEAALKLAANGIPVFPCDPRSKHPLPPADINSDGKKIQGTGGHKKATTDAKQITTWWTRWPGAAIGTPTGTPETGVVCDLDNKNGKDGFAAIPDWESLTPMIVATPHDGKHLWFRYEGSLRSTSSQIAPGVDTRGDNAYVLVPPSPGYRFVKGNFSCLSELPPWPQQYRLPEREAAQEHVSGTATAPIEHIAAAVQNIPNADLDWERWNEIGMAIFRATDGDPDGFMLFDTWSQRSTKYDFDNCLARWEHWESSSPPTRIGAGTLFHLADKTGSKWRDDPRIKVAAADEFSEVRELYEESAINAKDDNKTPLPFINIPAWEGKPLPERDWVVDTRVLAESVTLLSGEGGMGKTLIALDLAARIAIGHDAWLGASLPKDGAAVVLCCEDDEDEMHRRVADIGENLHCGYRELGKRLHLLSLAGVADTVLAIPDAKGIIRPTKLYARFREAVMDIRPRLVVIDNAADVFAGSEINRSEVRQFVGILRGLAMKSGAGIILNAHPSLSGIASGSGLSGSTHWHNSVRGRLYLRAPKADEDINPEYRVLETLKQNYYKGGEKTVVRWQRGVFHEVTSKETAERNDLIDDTFIGHMFDASKEGTRLSPSSNSPAYAPKIFAAYGHYGKGEYEKSMHRLLQIEKIKIVDEGPTSRAIKRLVLA